MFYNTTFPACYVLHKLKICRQHALIYVKFSPLFTGYTYVWVAALESHKNQCQTQLLSPRGPTAAPTPILYKWRPRAVSDVSEKTILANMAYQTWYPQIAHQVQ